MGLALATNAFAKEQNAYKQISSMTYSSGEHLGRALAGPASESGAIADIENVGARRAAMVHTVVCAVIVDCVADTDREKCSFERGRK